MLRSIILAVMLAVTGCATQTADSDPYVTFARDYFQLLQRRDLATAKSRFDPEVSTVPDYKSEDLDAELAFVTVLVPTDPPLSSKVVENRSGLSAGVAATIVAIEYQFPDGPRRFEITMRKNGRTIVARFVRVHLDIDLKGGTGT